MYGRSRIGTAPACEIRIDHPSLAEIYVEIVIRPEQATLTAVGGIGATSVNQQAAVVRDLADGDHLRLGDVEFAYHAARTSQGGSLWAHRWVRVGGVVFLVLLASFLFR